MGVYQGSSKGGNNERNRMDLCLIVIITHKYSDKLSAYEL